MSRLAVDFGDRVAAWAFARTQIRVWLLEGVVDGVQIGSGRRLGLVGGGGELLHQICHGLCGARILSRPLELFSQCWRFARRPTES